MNISNEDLPGIQAENIKHKAVLKAKFMAAALDFLANPNYGTNALMCKLSEDILDNQFAIENVNRILGTSAE
jgi:hypothetical protein